MLMIITCWVLLQMRNILENIYRESRNIYFIFNRFFPKSHRLCDNVGKYKKAGQTKDDSTKRLMRIAWCISEATDTLSKYKIINPYPANVDNRVS
jgi:hypothetical protein